MYIHIYIYRHGERNRVRETKIVTEKRDETNLGNVNQWGVCRKGS